uniref:(northern house mosquito) hypothetical protein n=2 Tax=Culex pipiens TaxID=7175 RepID=A0A8D8FPW9_CULPI
MWGGTCRRGGGAPERSDHGWKIPVDVVLQNAARLRTDRVVVKGEMGHPEQAVELEELEQVEGLIVVEMQRLHAHSNAVGNITKGAIVEIGIIIGIPQQQHVAWRGLNFANYTNGIRNVREGSPNWTQDEARAVLEIPVLPNDLNPCHNRRGPVPGGVLARLVPEPAPHLLRPACLGGADDAHQPAVPPVVERGKHEEFVARPVHNLPRAVGGVHVRRVLGQRLFRLRGQHLAPRDDGRIAGSGVRRIFLIFHNIFNL